jgi:hypothetical protein
MTIPSVAHDSYLGSDEVQDTPESLYEAWREARERAASAYEAWCRTSIEERRNAYAVYLAAVDQEAAAEREFLDMTQPVPSAARGPRALNAGPDREGDR